jgi:uncharacterized protein YbjT (DUF2867 family)
VLSLFPALLVLASLVGLFANPQRVTQVLTDTVSQLGPATAAKTFQGPIQSITGSRGTAGVMFVVGLVSALWAASGYVSAFAEACNSIYEVEEARPFWKLKPFQLAVTFALIMLAALVALGLVLTGPVVGALGGALEAARVPRVVSLSSVGADLDRDNGPIAGLHDLEQRLDRLAGASVLHLRPGFFMENQLNTIPMMKSMSINGSAMRGDVAIPQIATRDIGEVAAARLLALDFQGHEVQELHGQRDLTMEEATRALGKAVGRPDLKYVPFPYDEARKGLVQAGLTEDLASLYVEMQRGFNEGKVKPTQARSARTTTPTSIETFAETVFKATWAA